MMPQLARRSKMQTKQLELLNQQIEAKSTRMWNLALRNKWQEMKNIKNYQSEYDRNGNHLANNTLTHNHQRGASPRNKWSARSLWRKGLRLYAFKQINIKKYLVLRYFKHIDFNNAFMHKQPTYDEMVHETITHPTDKIGLPDRMATILRNTPQLTRFDDDSFLNLNEEQGKITQERMNSHP
jgi:hypothetical protein